MTNLKFLGFLGLNLHWSERLGAETSKNFHPSLEKVIEIYPPTFQGTSTEIIRTVADIVQIEKTLYEIGILNGAKVGDFGRRSIGRHPRIVQLRRYSCLIG